MKTPKLPIINLMLVCCLAAALSGCHKKLEYKSLDLKTYNLAGYVKQMVTMQVPVESANEGKSLTEEQIAEKTQTADTLNFTEEGGLYMPELKFEMLRDSIGRVLGINHAYGFAHKDNNYYIIKFTYDDNGMVSSYFVTCWSSDYTINCTYDKLGILIKTEGERTYESIESKFVTTYKILATDTAGNWTRRIAHTDEKITDNASEDTPTQLKSSDLVELRKIEYWNKE